MKTFIAVLSLCLSAAAQAQPVPSVLIPLAPCRLFDSRVSQGGPGPIAGGTALHLTARGACNVPEEATAIAFTVAAISPSATGNLLVWEENLTKPNAATLNYGTTNTSTGGLTRLCYPAIECTNDLQIQPSQTTEIILDITGAYVPLDSIESATSAIAGEITEIHEAQGEPEGTWAVHVYAHDSLSIQ